MLRVMTMKTAKIFAALVTAIFLVIHIGLYGLFSSHHVTPMAYFNIFSIAFYVAVFFVVWKLWLRVFVVAVYLEVVLHMFFATLFTGIESGFYITLIGVTILVFYAEFVGRYMHIKAIRAIPLSAVGGVAYVASVIISHMRPAPYSLPDEACFTLQVVWGVVSFVVMSFFLYTFVQITINSNRLLEQQAGHDQLTELPNRHFLLERLDEMKAKTGLEDHWIAMIDIDDFKVINDTYGHNCGDDILRGLADMLRACPDSVTSGRWGGEEFILYGKIDGDMEDCHRLLDNLRQKVMDQIFTHDDLKLHFTITIGYARYQPGETIDQWIDHADRCMYQGKKSGKNQVVA